MYSLEKKRRGIQIHCQCRVLTDNELSFLIQNPEELNPAPTKMIKDP
jgi:hypothetical protein